jgi:hypothetical protein
MEGAGGFNVNASCSPMVSAADAIGKAVAPLATALLPNLLPQPCVTMSSDYAGCTDSAILKAFTENPLATATAAPLAAQSSCFCGLATLRNNEIEQCYTEIASWMTDAPVTALSASYVSLCGGTLAPVNLGNGLIGHAV